MSRTTYYIAVSMYEFTPDGWAIVARGSQYAHDLTWAKRVFDREAASILDHAVKGTGRRKVVTRGIEVTGLIKGIMRRTICTWDVANL